MQNLKTINPLKMVKDIGLGSNDLGVLRKTKIRTWIKYFKKQIETIFEFSLSLKQFLLAFELKAVL